MGGTPATPSFLPRVATGGILSVGLDEGGRVVGKVADVFVVEIVEGFFVGV